MRTSIKNNNPVIFAEPALLYGMKGEVPDEYYEKTVEDTPVGIMGQPHHVAKVAMSLIDNEYISGENIVVDGGRILN